MALRDPAGLNSTLNLIGATPLIALDRLSPRKGRLLAKVEFLQPGGSIKDRAALGAIEAARKRGDLAPGQHVVEMSSGNMGAGLAVVCAALGHPLTITMSAGNSPARRRMIEAMGAKVVIVPQVDGSAGEVTGRDIGAAAAKAKQIAAFESAWYVDQFHNKDCTAAHESTTGPEIWDQSKRQVTTFVMGVGTGSTFTGVASYLKRQDQHIRCYAMEPAQASVLGSRQSPPGRHILQGIGYGFQPPQWRPELCDGAISVTDEEARNWRERLARSEGLFVGLSSGANVAAAVRLLEEDPLGNECVVTILCDTGLKYS